MTSNTDEQVGPTPGLAEGERDMTTQSDSNRARPQPASSSIERLTSGMPKMIGPTAHAALDYSTVAALVAMGLALRDRNRTASTFAFINAATVFAASVMTDYPGGLFRRISFQAHGLMDVAQAGMLATGPALLGFSDRPEAQWFYAQAAMEAGVVSATDWNQSA